MQLRKLIAVLAAGLACISGLLAATTSPKKVTPKKPIVAHHTTARTRTKSPHPAASAQHRSAAKHSPTRPAWHPGQTGPTADRYKEIQEALAKKGYLHGEANGVWSQDSADALRRFQQDQNLQASGKLDSLSIIALGLGPKY